MENFEEQFSYLIKEIDKQFTIFINKYLLKQFIEAKKFVELTNKKIHYFKCWYNIIKQYINNNREIKQILFSFITLSYLLDGIYLKNVNLYTDTFLKNIFNNMSKGFYGYHFNTKININYFDKSSYKILKQLLKDIEKTLNTIYL